VADFHLILTRIGTTTEQQFSTPAMAPAEESGGALAQKNGWPISTNIEDSLLPNYLTVNNGSLHM
jgi:hypothetical protein